MVKFTMLTTLDNERLDAMFAALANRTRRQMIERLAEGDASVSELAEPFDISMPAISRHIKVLEEADLITQGRKGQYRPCSLNGDTIESVAEWAAQYRQIWDTSFERLDNFLGDLRPDNNETPKKPKEKS